MVCFQFLVKERNSHNLLMVGTPYVNIFCFQITFWIIIPTSPYHTILVKVNKKCSGTYFWQGLKVYGPFRDCRGSKPKWCQNELSASHVWKISWQSSLKHHLCFAMGPDTQIPSNLRKNIDRIFFVYLSDMVYISIRVGVDRYYIKKL